MPPAARTSLTSIQIESPVTRFGPDALIVSSVPSENAALPKMVERNSGNVVMMSSLAAFRGMPGNAAYCASKAAVATFMESVRVDLQATRVRATTIYPGFVKTSLTAKNKFGESTKVATNLIMVGTGPRIDFKADKTLAGVDRFIRFTDLSTNNPTTWVWEKRNGIWKVVHAQRCADLPTIQQLFDAARRREQEQQPAGGK